MFPDHPSITANDSQSEPECIERITRAMFTRARASRAAAGTTCFEHEG